MKLTSTDFRHMSRLDTRFAFCAPDSASHVRLSDNLNPALAGHVLAEALLVGIYSLNPAVT